MEINQIKLPYRITLLLLVVFTQLRQQLDYCISESWVLTCFGRNKYLSIQSNYLVALWLLLYVLWRNNEEQLKKLDGKFRGAVTVYITIVWLAYYFLLSSGDHPTGWLAFTNISQHYIVPIAFIIDWFIFERMRYSWSYFKTWTIYPIAYAAFALINGMLDLHLGYIYGFLDADKNGWGSVWIMVLAIFLLYTILSVLYITINNKVLVKNTE